MRKIVVAIGLMFILFLIGGLFWYTDLIYQLPTPVPANYRAVNRGQLINIKLPASNTGRPILLHFFNPDCPCSRFNISNFKRLYTAYNNKVNFVIVVMSNKPYTVKAIQDKFGLPVPVLFNPAIAIACGVYSTPQVALLNARHQLYYRGNYNSSRYCTDEKTNYAKFAIDGLLNNNTHLAFSMLALRAYGCQLPNCSK